MFRPVCVLVVLILAVFLVVSIVPAVLDISTDAAYAQIGGAGKKKQSNDDSKASEEKRDAGNSDNKNDSTQKVEESDSSSQKPSDSSMNDRRDGDIAGPDRKRDESGTKDSGSTVNKDRTKDSTDRNERQVDTDSTSKQPESVERSDEAGDVYHRPRERGDQPDRHTYRPYGGRPPVVVVYRPEYTQPKVMTPKEAVDRICTAWLQKEPEWLIPLFPDSKGKIDIYRNGKYSYSLDPEEFYTITKEAIRDTDTVTFKHQKLSYHGIRSLPQVYMSIGFLKT